MTGSATFTEQLEAAFDALTKQGIIAEHTFLCCNNCGGSAMQNQLYPSWSGAAPATGYVFYHEQDADYVVAEGGTTLYLSHGSFGDHDEANAALIVKVLREHGLQVDWDGDPARRIRVELTREQALSVQRTRLPYMSDDDYDPAEDEYEDDPDYGRDLDDEEDL